MKPTSITTTTTTTTNSNSLTMESLALPRELYWDGKTEPTSPPSNELFSISEPSVNWLYDDNFANGITIITDDDDMELKPGLELDFPHELIDGDDIVIELCDLKEEWSDSKLLSTTLPLEYQIGAIIPQPNTITKVNHNTFNIGILDSTILTTLTPPQSPPQNSVSPVATTLQAIISTESQNNLHHNNNVLQQQQQQSSQTVLPVNTNAISLSTSSTLPISNSATSVQNVNFYGNQAAVNALIPEITDDIARETQIVDEILNIRAKELLDWHECESQSSFSAPSLIGSIEEDDWLPDSYSYSSASSSPVHLSGEELLPKDLPTSASFSSSSSIISTSSSSSASSLPTKKRTRPYGRGVEDRKIRKKEQNKNAATRYRQKKKVEMECVLSEESVLLQRNEELKLTLADRKREAKYLKELLREMYNKK